MVIATAESTQTPVAMAATFSLGIVSAAMGGKAHIAAGSFAALCMYGPLSVSPSGAGKSPVYRALVAPLREVIQRSQDEVEEPVQTLDYWDALEGTGARIDRALEASAKLRARQQAHDSEEPVQFVFDDVTVDGLLVEMAKQTMGIAQLSAESGWTELGKRGYRVLNHLNLCWDGEAISGSRIGRKHPRIDRPALTCGLFAQRQPWFDLLKQGAAVSSGYLPRFLVADVPSSRRRAPFTSIPKPVTDAWNDGIFALLAAEKGIELSLSRDASLPNSDSFNEFQAAREALPAEDRFAYWLEKAPQNVLRVAALLHLAGDDESNVVSVEDVSNSRAIVRVLIEHTRQLVKDEPRSTKTKGSQVLMAPSVLDRAAALFGEETFKVSELADRLGRAGRGKTDQLKRQLDTLVSQGAIERLPRRSTGGRSEAPSTLCVGRRRKCPHRLGKCLLLTTVRDPMIWRGGVEATSAAPGGPYLTDRVDGEGQWLDLSGIGDDETISVAELRTRLSAAPVVKGGGCSSARAPRCS